MPRICTPRSLAALCALSFALAQSAAAPGTEPGQPAYHLPDGSVQIVGNRALSGIIGQLDALYESSHPGVRFSPVYGDDGTAMAALTFGTSPVALMGGEYTAAGLTAARKLVGPDPLAVRIAHGSGNPAAGFSPPAVIVHLDNPIDVLTLEAVERIFCQGAPKSDLTHWGQLGLKGIWARSAITPCGLPESDVYSSDDPTLGGYLMGQKFVGLHFAHTYQACEHYADVLEQVRTNPKAIGIVALNRVSAGVKVVAIASDDWSPASRGTSADIASGRYAFDRPIYLYLRRVPGRPLDPLAVDYALQALSENGQRAIGAEASGYIPLSVGEREQELRKIQ